MSGKTKRPRTSQVSAAGVLGLLLLAASCVTEERSEETRIRLNIDEGAIKVSVLGTAAPGEAELASDLLGLPRQPAALAIRSPQEGSLFLIDLSPAILEQLASLGDLVQVDPAGARPLVQRVFLTHMNRAVIPGLIRLLQAILPGQKLEVTGTRAMLAAIASDRFLVRTGQIERIHLSEAIEAEPLELGRTLRITPFRSPEDGRGAFLGYRIEGSRRALVYLPACGSLESLKEAVVECRFGPVRILLADGTRFDDREEPLPGRPAGCHPPMTEVLSLIRPGSPGAVRLRFTNLPPHSPALDPDGRYLTLLRQAGAQVESDGSEYWL